VDTIKKQECPMCHEKTLTLIEDEKDIPYFGKTYIFSMTCSSCKYHMADVESEEKKNSCKITFTIEKEDDMKVRVVKSSEAKVKIPQLKMEIIPGQASIGYVSNIEGLLNRFEEIIESERDNEEDMDIKKKAKNLLKKIRRAKFGDEKLKIIIEDPSGSSAIISDRAEVKSG